MKDNDEFTSKDFLVVVTHPKGEGGGWTCVEDNIIG